jgi:PIN domain nuclease of toxin-antitoxin system
VILLDTHIWIWWVENPLRIPRGIRAAVLEAERESAIRVSVISVLEIAVKAAKGSLVLPLDIVTWVERASSYPGVTVENLAAVDAIGSSLLPVGLPGDPFDRILVAMSRRLGARLATVDRNLRAYRHVRTVPLS